MNKIINKIHGRKMVAKNPKKFGMSGIYGKIIPNMEKME